MTLMTNGDDVVDKCVAAAEMMMMSPIRPTTTTTGKDEAAAVAATSEENSPSLQNHLQPENNNNIKMKEAEVTSSMTATTGLDSSSASSPGTPLSSVGSCSGNNNGCGGSLVGKTPVSLLQELYVRQGITPKYDLVQIEGAVHEPTFKYIVTVGDFMATGSGQSKKKAKHSAAKTILDKLRVANQIPKSSGGGGKLDGGNNVNGGNKDIIRIPDEGELLLSPYDDGIQGNPVGELQELCMNRRMQPPTYEVSRQEGQPHERSFVILCLVANSNYKESGSGKSKKLAKRQAAHKMLTRLKEIRVENDDNSFGHDVIDEDDLAQGIVQRNSTLKDISRSSSSNMFKFYKNLRVVIGSKLMDLQEEETRVNLNQDDNAVNLLREISEEQEFKVTYVDIEERAKNGDHHCLLQLSTSPVAVAYGSGNSEKEAKNNSAFNALEYLRIITKK